MATTPPPESISADDQRALFAAAVDMLGGQRKTARLLDVTDRTIRDLVSGRRALHTGFLRDISAALVDHGRKCRMVERRLNPFFAANRTADQNAETPDGRRYDAAQTTVDAMTANWAAAARDAAKATPSIKIGPGVIIPGSYWDSGHVGSPTGTAPPPKAENNGTD